MAKKILNGLDLTNQKITNLADPTSATDGANKQYVDNLILGLSFKNEVRVATTTNGTLASAFANASTVDGITLATGDRILIKNQTTQTENGIYTVNSSGAPTRATDADTTSEMNNATVLVTVGTTNGGTMWTQTTANPTIGSSNIVWAQFISGITYSAGNGINITTGTISAVAGTGITVGGGGIAIDSAYSGLAKRYAVNVPNGSTSAAITHSLGTLDVIVALYEVSGGAEVETDLVLTSTSVVTLTFATAPTAGQYRAVVLA